ncbi:hypothetical protein [Caudoviricetes sp.]|nr:hypothetical protein [Caudoviricetes sp.]
MPVYEIKDLNVGLNTSNPEISTIFALDTNQTYNVVVSGLNGIGARQGILPLPGQNESSQGGLEGSESASYSYKNRLGVYGLVQTKIQGVNQLFWITSADRGAYNTIDICKTSTSALESALVDSSVGVFSDGSLLNMYLSNTQTRYITSDLSAYSFFSVRGRDISLPYLFFLGTDLAATNPGLPVINTAGWTSEMQLATYYPNARNFKIQGIFASSGTNYMSKIYEYDAKSLAYTALSDESDTTPYTTFGAANRTVSRLTTPSFVNGTALGGLVFDPLNKHNSSYRLLALCSDNPVGAIFQDGFKTSGGEYISWVNFSDNKLEPQSIRTLNESGTSYTEDGVPKATCWKYFPDFDSTTALTSSSSSAWDGNIHVRLGAANSGVLIKNTIYEIAFSMYDARLDWETNVGTPAMFLTGSDDAVSIHLCRRKETTAVNAQVCPNSMNIPFPPFSYSTGTKINWLQYRVYFRERGTFEWRPAGAVWFSELYDATRLYFAFCEGDDVALPGGQPGGFNDYSLLPRDSWKFNVVYRDRLFWISDKQLIFSNRNSPLTYPARNSISCPTGEFKGMLVHAYYGQSQQNARLVVFSTDSMYIGTFTGELIQQPVQVSVDSVGTFPLDGSDFVLDLRTSITAFSSKAAVVVEGILYFWGSQGVFMDNGLEVPVKVSQIVEPWLESIYDSTNTDYIHCVYDATTKDITWFYIPKDAVTKVTEPTHALVYNVKKNTFHRLKFNQYITSAQSVNIQPASSSKDLVGQRTIIYSKLLPANTINRAYFYDSQCKCGDTTPTTEFLVKEITAPSTGIRRFILESNVNQAVINGIKPNDAVYLIQAEKYTGDSNYVSGKYTVHAVGTGYIEVENSTLPTGSLTNGNFIPLQTDDQGIDYALVSRYWAPAGLYSWNEFSRTFISIRNDNATGQAINISMQTPQSSFTSSKTVTIKANADANFFALSDYRPNKQATMGNAIRLSFSGTLSTGYFRIEHLNVLAAASDAVALMQFQG